MANTKYLNQVKLNSTFTPSNSAIVASDTGQVVAEKTQGQINAIAAPTGVEPVFNGIENSALFSVTYSAANRQFSVTYTAGAAYTVGGVRYTHAAGTVTTTAHANTSGAYYLYYDAAGALTVSATFWNLLITAPVAYVYYNSSNAGGAAAGVLQNEFHPGVTGMSNATHLNLHTTRGTQLLSGCVATGYTLNTGGAANVNWTTTSGSVADEDLILSVTAQALGGANTYRILWLTGTTVAPVWNWIDQAESGVYSNGTNIYYNQNNAGTWQLTAITNNSRWVNYYIVATTAYNAPQIIVVMGQNTYTSLSAAQAGTFATDCSNFGSFTSEAVVLYQVIYRRASSNGAPGNAEISAFTRVIQNLVIVGLSAATQASNVTVNTSSFSRFFTVADNNVQQALNDLDDNISNIFWQAVKTSNFTAVSGYGYVVNTTGGTITVTLPATPVARDIIALVDYAGTFSLNKLTIAANGNKINGVATDITLENQREAIQLLYIDATQGWLIYSGFNTSIYNVSVLIAAGGGSGGGDPGGGGGAGGLITGTIGLTTNYIYVVYIGAGGAYVNTGTSSSVFALTPVGGGYGGLWGLGAGGNGGSGGGAAFGGSIGYAAFGQGNNGGLSSGSSNPNYGSGGGGGDGSTGYNGVTNVGGNGGTGLASSITGSSVYYCSGGGGGSYSGAAGTASAGGGGNGATTYNTTPANGSAGTANTGGGGGGGSGYGGIGGTGGSGIVIISVPTIHYSGLTTGSPTITTSGSNTILKFTSSGSYTA